MNRELKILWLNALRSGHYKKGNGGLHMPDGSYCCLGVLSCVLTGSASDTQALLPQHTVNFLGINQTELVALNDNNETWDEVIKYIEENL